MGASHRRLIDEGISRATPTPTRQWRSVWLGAALAVVIATVLPGVARAVTVTRGAYLQLGTPTSIVVRWRTDVPTDSRVRYGTHPSSLTQSASVGTVTTEHQVVLDDLAPGTRYYYSVGSASTVLAGGDATHTFVTSPPAGTSRPTRIWVIGDSGTATASAAAVRDAYLRYTGTRGTDVWLMLGDNAYESGTDAQYQAGLFRMYPTLLRQTPLWPTFGNHDAMSANSAGQTGPYYSSFTLPAHGEAGGVASGTEAYYSFDRSNAHFIVLDSSESDRSATGRMATWLRADLAANTKRWIIASWHHPPYTRGSHNSETEIELRQMRQNLLPILEAYNADLVLTGHSHAYERSFLIDRHYGASSSFTSAMKKDGGDGRVDGTGAYEKLGLAPHEGTVYVVAGNAGRLEGALGRHPAMFASLYVLGSMVIDVNGNRLDAKMIDAAGAVRDHFTILKGGVAPTPPPPPTTALQLTVANPAAAAAVRGTATISLAATGGSGYRYTLRVDGGQVYAGTNPTFSWNSTVLSNGVHTLAATVTDAAGRTATATRSVTVSNGTTAPFTASLSYPAAGATVKGSMTVGMATTATWGRSKTFRLSVDGRVIVSRTITGTTLWLPWDTRGVANGRRTLTLAVTYNGSTATTTRTVTVNN